MCNRCSICNSRSICSPSSMFSSSQYSMLLLPIMRTRCPRSPCRCGCVELHTCDKLFVCSPVFEYVYSFTTNEQYGGGYGIDVDGDGVADYVMGGGYAPHQVGFLRCNHVIFLCLFVSFGDLFSHVKVSRKTFLLTGIWSFVFSLAVRMTVCLCLCVCETVCVCVCVCVATRVFEQEYIHQPQQVQYVQQPVQQQVQYVPAMSGQPMAAQYMTVPQVFSRAVHIYKIPS